MWLWLRTVSRHALSDLKDSFGSPIALLFTGSVFFLSAAIWLYRERAKPMSWRTLFGLAIPIAVSIVIVSFVLGIKALYSAFKEADDRALTAEAETARLTQKPIIDVHVKDAFIVPQSGGSANCFLHLSLHNDTQVACYNPRDYSLAIRIKGINYSRNVPLNLHNYKLVHYKTVMVYDDDTEPYESQQQLSEASLTPNVAAIKEQLVRGTRIEGWLGISIHGLPNWEYDEMMIGERQEFEYDDEGQAKDCKWVPDYKRVLHARNVEMLKVELTDPYKQSWSCETQVFNVEGKKIVKKEPRRDIPPDV